MQLAASKFRQQVLLIYTVTVVLWIMHAARLDRVERRYNWFKRELQEKHHAWSIFPSGWQVQQTLCEQFCKLTRAHVAEMLDSLQVRKCIIYIS